MEIIERICHLINRKATGKPKELAKKLNTSESTIKRIIGELKDRGFPIQFYKMKNSYVCSEGKIIFTIRMEVEPLSKDDMQEIRGGGCSAFFKKYEKKYADFLFKVKFDLEQY